MKMAPFESTTESGRTPVRAGTAGPRVEDRSRLLRALARVSRRQKRLARLLSETEELADAIVQDLQQLSVDLHAVPADTRALLLTVPRRACLPGNGGEFLRKESERGALSLRLAPLLDGHVRVGLNGAPEFPIPPVLGKLLSILSEDDGPSDDGIVRWKTLAEVARRLGKSATRRSRHAVSQHVSRLKQEFRLNGENWRLIQTRRKGLVRFALIRPPRPSSAIGSDGADPHVGSALPSPGLPSGCAP